MKKFRISVGGLMVVVVIAAIGIAALRSASELWASFILTLTFGILATASLGALLRRGERRAFWIGFAAFGWGYIVLCFWTQVGDRLVTTPVLDRFYEDYGPWKRFTFSVVTPVPGGLPSPPAPKVPILVWGSTLHHTFRRIGHCLFGLTRSPPRRFHRPVLCRPQRGPDYRMTLPVGHRRLESANSHGYLATGRALIGAGSVGTLTI